MQYYDSIPVGVLTKEVESQETNVCLNHMCQYFTIFYYLIMKSDMKIEMDKYNTIQDK